MAYPVGTQFFWGIDSAMPANQSLTFKDVAYNSLYELVVDAYGKPDFWGRYLDKYAITTNEADFLHNNGVSIMLIYGASLTQTNVESYVYQDGLDIAQDAVRLAKQLYVPAGTLIYFDLENWSVHYSFLEGLADGMYGDAYEAGYYTGGFYATMGGNNDSSGSFNSSYCTALSANANVSNMYLYSNEPEPGCTTQANKPTYTPHYPSCNSNVTVWQYAERCLETQGSDSPYPNGIVDQDISVSSAYDLFWS